MSNRAIGRLYGGGYHPAYGGGGYGGGGDRPSLLEALFGSGIGGGGITTDPTTGLPQVTPFTSKGGLFNRAARNRAQELNAQLFGQQMIGQQERAQSIQDAVNKLAGELGVTPDQITGGLKDQLYDTANTRQKQILENMNTPEFHKALAIGQNTREAGINPNLAFPNVGAGATALAPNLGNLGGGPNVVRGATQAPARVEYMTIPDGKGGVMQVPRLTAGGGQIPGSVNLAPGGAADRNIVSQARNLNESPSIQDMITTGPSSSMTNSGFMSTDEGLRPPSRYTARQRMIPQATDAGPSERTNSNAADQAELEDGGPIAPRNRNSQITTTPPQGMGMVASLSDLDPRALFGMLRNAVGNFGAARDRAFYGKTNAPSPQKLAGDVGPAQSATQSSDMTQESPFMQMPQEQQNSPMDPNWLTNYLVRQAMNRTNQAPPGPMMNFPNQNSPGLNWLNNYNQTNQQQSIPIDPEILQSVIGGAQ